MIRTITINSVVYTFVCEWKKTRSAFKHVCSVFKNDIKIGEVKICYLNRTWESYEFQSVLNKAADKFNINHRF